MSAFSSTADPSGSGIRHWHQLAVVLRHSPGTASSLLRKPPPTGVPSKNDIAEITAAAQQHVLTDLLDRHLLSGFLLTPRERQDQWPLTALDVAERLFPGVGREIVQAAPWIHVPILAVQGKSRRLVTMMLGLLPDSTGCVVGLPAPDALTAEAVCRAYRTSGWEHGIAYWFLQQNDEQPVQGNSLALPVALGLDFLSQSVSWPEGLYATGGLELDGNIIPVAHVQEKYRHVTPFCRLFLAPADTALPETPDQTIHACTNIDDARFAALLYSGGTTAADISLYQACWISEHNFFNHYHELPPAMTASARADDFFLQAAAEPENYLILLSRCFSKCSHDRLRGQRMADLFTPETIQNLTGSSPSLDFALFYWCLAAVAFHNHCGQIRKSHRWNSCAEALHSRIDLKEIGKAVNHAFVSRRFNRYDFRPELTPELAAALEVEERKQKVYPGSNALLGAFYGTMAQNYGFCGPSHLPSLLAMTARARQAFGKKYQHEADRLLNYDIYGHLDNGKIDQAWQLTGKYLGLNASCGPEEWLQRVEMPPADSDASGPFKIALVMRLLSEAGYEPSPAHIMGRVSIICRQHGHPWQLIALNFGRMAANTGRLKEAAQLFRHSLHICQDDSDTMRPMGLLALAELHTTGLADDDDYREAQETRQWLKRTNSLNTDHFQIIIALNDNRELLHVVNRERSRLFPFSYR